MTKSKRLIFLGTEDFSAPALEALLAAGWPVLAVVTKPDSPAGRGQQLKSPKVKDLAEKAKIKVLQPDKLTGINDEVAALKPDFGVLVAYGKIIPQSTLDLFPDGVINLHPSLLPRYRGPSPIEAAILNGDKETGLSLIRLTAQMDAGPVYAQQRVELKGTETKPELYRLLARQGADFLLKRLEAIADGYLAPKPQIEAEATYTKLIKKEDGVLDMSKPAEQLEREVRAYAGWPKSSMELFGQKVIVTKAEVIDGKFQIKELIAPSGREMSGADFNRGYQKG